MDEAIGAANVFHLVNRGAKKVLLRPGPRIEGEDHDVADDAAGRRRGNGLVQQHIDPAANTGLSGERVDHPLPIAPWPSRLPQTCDLNEAREQRSGKQEHPAHPHRRQQFRGRHSPRRNVRVGAARDHRGFDGTLAIEERRLDDVVLDEGDRGHVQRDSHRRRDGGSERQCEQYGKSGRQQQVPDRGSTARRQTDGEQHHEKDHGCLDEDRRHRFPLSLRALSISARSASRSSSDQEPSRISDVSISRSEPPKNVCSTPWSAVRFAAVGDTVTE
jgi:hypothetical protein